MAGANEINYKVLLMEVFNGIISEKQVDEVISIVLTQNECQSSSDEKIEAMINLLTESGDSTLAPGSRNLAEEGDEEAFGYAPNNDVLVNQHFSNLLELFPDICPNYLAGFCRKYTNFNFENVVDDLSNMDYEKRERDPLDIWDHLKEMLPAADPTYLRNQARVLVERPVGELQEFIQNALDKHDYPTYDDYLKDKEKQNEISCFTRNFRIPDFLEKFPDPFIIFQNPQRNSLSGENVDPSDILFAQNFLYNQYPFLRKREIDKIFKIYGHHLIRTSNKLKGVPKAFRDPRPVFLYELECKNRDLLQDIAFLKNERGIRRYIKQKNKKYEKALEEARQFGLLQTCSCCFDDELIPEECYFCNDGCIFCKGCVKLGTETVIGRGETTFPCLADCGSEFHYSTLQLVLDKSVFKNLCDRRQMEEVKKANIEGIEMCKYCNFAMVPDPSDKIFKCPKCNKETCRGCGYKAHVPLKCSEMEYDEDVKMRVLLETEMTKALLIVCSRCARQFYKESGCNKMTCICGNKMCYVCKSEILDYSHFANSAGKCPLYTENLKDFHLKRVRAAAESVKGQLGGKLKEKFDPSKDLAANIA